MSTGYVHKGEWSVTAAKHSFENAGSMNLIMICANSEPRVVNL